MVGAFVAATVVTLVQFVRVRDRRMLALATLFACQAQALGREWWDVWRDVAQAGACAAGLCLLWMLSPLPARRAAPDGASRPSPASLTPAAPPGDAPPAASADPAAVGDSSDPSRA
jgi:hypothetical protein